MNIRKGQLVLVEHGSSTTGQVAVVDKVAGDLVTVRKYRANSNTFAKGIPLPRRAVLGTPERSDKRRAAARALLDGKGKRAAANRASSKATGKR